MLDLATMLAAVPRCPVCDFDRRAPCTAEALPPSPYTRRLGEAVGMSAEAVLAEMPLWSCARCRANWHDPWLTPAASQWLYDVAMPLHRYGWISLQHWIEGRPAPFMDGRQAVWELLRARAPGPLRYAEFNCPFTGLAFAEAERFGRQGREALALRQRQLAAGAAEARIVADDRDAFLRERTLLTARSPMCWGENCRARGVSCRALASGLLFRRVLTLEEAERAGERFDLIGTFILDHMPDPDRTLFRLLALSQRVLLELHPPGWTDAQHLYNLNPMLIEFVRRNGVHVRNLGALVGDAWTAAGTGALLFMLSRDDDLAWLG